MYDYHIHSNFSVDSNSEIQEICKFAIEKRLRGICITDHIDIDNPEYNIENIFSYENYSKQINECKSKYGDILEIYKGIELGLQCHVLKQNENFLDNKYFDFVLASIHTVNKKEMYDLDYLKGISDVEAIDLYFDNVIKCIACFNNFDVLGHIDVFRRYLSQGEKSFIYKKHEEKLEYILSSLININKGIEINTSGLRYNLSSFHPISEILKLYGNLNGEIITIGSDSHSPHHLGYEFNKVMKLLKDYKFSYYTIFESRKPRFIKIEG